MVAAYRVRSRFLRLADAGAGPPSEAELSRIWAAQSFPAAALGLVDGRPLRIILPGRPGGGAGPDYRDAVIAIDGVERRGDLELHVRASSFEEHGHHRDPAYDNLVLHVVYSADGGPSTLLHSGGRVPVAAFAPWLGQRTRQLQEWLAAPPLWLEPCSDAVGRLGKERVRETLEAEGRRRFETKTARLGESAAALGAAEALWLALLDNLGYGNDRAAWRRLAALLPVSLLRSLTAGLAAEQAGGQVEAALLATAGLAAPLPDLAPALPRPLSPPLAGGSRPASRPERRLRALAGLWQRAAGDIPAYAHRTVATAERLGDLTAAWTVAGRDGPALLGEGRARELLLNAVLPFVALDEGLQAKALRLAAALPSAPAYGKTAFLEASLRRSDEGFRGRGALEQQGLLALVADWCRQGGCGRCPLS